MGLLDGIMSNKSMQQLAFSQLKKFFSDGNAKGIIVTVDEEGEIVVDMTKRGFCVTETTEDGKGWDNENKKFYGVKVKQKEDGTNNA